MSLLPFHCLPVVPELRPQDLAKFREDQKELVTPTYGAAPPIFGLTWVFTANVYYIISMRKYIVSSTQQLYKRDSGK